MTVTFISFDYGLGKIVERIENYFRLAGNAEEHLRVTVTFINFIYVVLFAGADGAFVGPAFDFFDLLGHRCG